MKRKCIILSGVMGMGILLLTGCGRDAAGKQGETGAVSDTSEEEDSTEGMQTDFAALSGESREQAESDAGQTEPGQREDTEQEEKTKQSESETEVEDTPKEAPQLPETGSQITDFVPEGWELWDSVELDFNEDGIPDYVGVLQAVLADEDKDQTFQPEYPRILFAAASDGTAGYCLDFQDGNVVRTRDEGGVFGDPYLPLTAERTSFTIHTYGGSAWRWSEDYTYTYREGDWWLASSEETYGYGDYVTDYVKNDWESGVGIRKVRSSDWRPMEENFEQIENGDWDSVGYDLEYEVPLDEQMTLEQAGKRWWLAPKRVTDWEVKETVFAADVNIAADKIRPPEDAFADYCDEDCLLYTFRVDSDTEESACYLAMYDWQDKVLSVLAEGDTAIDDAKLYDGKIYYVSEIVENVTYPSAVTGNEKTEQKEETVGVRLNRMEPDGSGKEVIFEYRYPEAASGDMEDFIPYLSLIYEISGGEIVVEVYLGAEPSKPHPFYRMKADGSGQERIGQVPK